jgi:hypothetical protein
MSSVDFFDCVCPRHSEPLRAKWPEGSGIFLSILTEFGAVGPEFANEAKFRDAIKITPLCCRLTKEQLYFAYRSMHLGFFDKCTSCGSLDLGAPYRYVDGEAGVEKHGHLCFKCIVWRFEEA